MGTVSSTLKKVIRVDQLTNQISSILENNFSSLGVQGEISSFNAHSSGHWYFTLKDKQSQIKAVMFKYSNQGASFKPQVGDEVILWGKLSVYKPRGDYQILCHKIEQAGEGIYQRQFEELKIKLNKEGLFERKKELPYLPRHIAVITSVEGAALRDVWSVLKRRCPGMRVTLIPAIMEGERSPISVMDALRQAYKMEDIDLILVTRGGGSAESLSCFNDEALARFAFEAPVPLVSAIGHEIDFTIMDFIADHRVATPSVAAEIISKNASDLISRVQQQRRALLSYHQHYIQKVVQKLHHYRHSIINPVSVVEDSLLKIDDLSSRLELNWKNLFQSKSDFLQKFKISLKDLNPTSVMDRGYCLCFNENQVISSSKALSRGDLITLKFSQGESEAEVKSSE